jgi:hypothetical protein
VDLVPWLGSTLDGFPPPRPYCPAALVGSWDAGGVAWQLGADGTVTTTEPAFAPYASWYVVRRGAAVGDQLKLAKRWGTPEVLVIARVAPDELDLKHFDGKVTRTHSLRRAT